MAGEETPELDLETDPRFPSGAWTGFFLQRIIPGRHWMELELTFRDGRMTGAGRDWVGAFALHGAYDLEDGRCNFVKQYLPGHNVDYRGFNEGKGIWGTWKIEGIGKGGFHIWPKGMADPTQQSLEEEADVPQDAEMVAAE